jgi:hypothetical protein
LASRQLTRRYLVAPVGKTPGPPGWRC